MNKNDIIERIKALEFIKNFTSQIIELGHHLEDKDLENINISKHVELWETLTTKVVDLYTLDILGEFQKLAKDGIEIEKTKNEKRTA